MAQFKNSVITEKGLALLAEGSTAHIKADIYANYSWCRRVYRYGGSFRSNSTERPAPERADLIYFRSGQHYSKISCSDL